MFVPFLNESFVLFDCYIESYTLSKLNLVTKRLCCAVFWLLSHFRLFAAPWTIAHKDPLSIKFSGQEDWSGLPFPSPGHCPDPEIEHKSALQTRVLYN